MNEETIGTATEEPKAAPKRSNKKAKRKAHKKASAKKSGKASAKQNPKKAAKKSSGKGGVVRGESVIVNIRMSPTMVRALDAISSAKAWTRVEAMRQCLNTFVSKHGVKCAEALPLVRGRPPLAR
jgi:hypothetical protein